VNIGPEKRTEKNPFRVVGPKNGGKNTLSGETQKDLVLRRRIGGLTGIGVRTETTLTALEVKRSANVHIVTGRGGKKSQRRSVTDVKAEGAGKRQSFPRKSHEARLYPSVICLTSLQQNEDPYNRRGMGGIQGAGGKETKHGT